MFPGDLLRMPVGDRGPALRQHALRRLCKLQVIEAEAARQIARRERELARLSRNAGFHRVDLPADVTARLHLLRSKTHG